MVSSALSLELISVDTVKSKTFHINKGLNCKKDMGVQTSFKKDMGVQTSLSRLLCKTECGGLSA